ncbi:four helix bundle protein [Halomonas sp. M4R1S46]|uniref:four helix bundle protein n=1 Tax=Halomonas sp. M4R1S46 TaxID=2982692 RepID=UPI0021E36DE2|nr:four helix bundle protein [Halomonas sp. M4R1S46]UYG06070.1 four helix bundle protein [Halomonas sp. M4R1S46]
MRSYHGLHAWQQGMQLVEEVYRLTARFPSSEQFGLTSQMRRAAVSIPSNIAEGAGRGSPAEFLRFLVIARGSLNELETQCQLAQRLGLTPDIQEIMERIEQVFAQLGGLIKHTRGKVKRNQTPRP